MIVFHPVHWNASMYFVYFYRADPDFWIGSKFKLKINLKRDSGIALPLSIFSEGVQLSPHSQCFGTQNFWLN